MAKRAKTSLTIVTSSDGLSVGTATGSFDMSDGSSVGAQFEIVKQNEEDQLATAGQVGAAFVQLDTPNVIEQIAIRPLAGQEIAVRLNGAPATVLGSGASFGTVAGGESFPLTVDGSGPVTVTLTASDTTAAACAARINAAAGAIVAAVESGQLRLTGTKTGGQLAKANTMQYGSLVVGAGTALAKLGLVEGTTYGSALADLRTNNRLFLEPPTSGAGAITQIELSGSGKIMTHLAGRAA